MTAPAIRAALERLESLTAEEIFFIPTRPTLDQGQLREALTDGRVDPHAFLHNAALVGEVVAAEHRLHQAEDALMELRVGRPQKQPVPPLLRVVGGDGHD